MLDIFAKSKIFEGKKGLIMGIANERSIAYWIANACHMQGAELAFSYMGDAFLKRLKPIATKMGSDFLIECDVSKNEDIDRAFAQIEERWGKLDFVVHAIAYSDKTELTGRYVDTSLENFLMSMHISCYSFTYVAKKAAELMPDGGSLLTLSYYGAEKSIPHYNVMGVCKAALESSTKYIAADLGKDNIRVNAISAGPVKTLAASGIGDFKYIFKWNEENSPMRRNITIEEVGGAATLLLSELGLGITGEIMHVDGGYNTVGMRAVDDLEEIKNTGKI